MANLVELFDNIVQMQNLNGVPLAAGKLYVYALGRTRLMDSWSDVDGESLNPNPIILDDAGQAHCYVSDSFDYTLVVCDQYNNEIFSIDKYLFSEGSHSHADVAVAPSEHIGVSSYHVGEVTVYVPYLTGEVGKVYEGIDPIVVNNTVNRISANHIPLGVQDPLYFVEDSETACIIGCSAQTEIPAELSGKWDEASDAVIANSAQWAEGTEYEAGSYIDIDGHTISVTGLQPEGDYAYNSALSSKLDVTALPQDLVHSGDLTAYQPAGNYLSATDSANFYPIDNPSGFITGVDLTDYATTAQLDEKLDKSDSGNFYPMEGNPSGFLTAHQSLQGYATEQWVEDKGYITGVDVPESATWNATTETVSSNSAQWGASNPQIPVTGINGIKISESGDKVVFEVSGDYYPGNNPSGFITGVDLSDYATTAQVADKLDTTAFSTVSGDFLTAVDLTPYQEKEEMTAYATVESLTSKQDAGDYLSATDSANFLLTSDSGNFYTTANESGFITGVDLTPYQTIEGMTAYQEAGDYYSASNPSGFITGVDLTPYQLTADMTAYQPVGDYLTTADSANFYTTANESGFISEVPAGTMNESAFEYDANDKISGYNGSAFAGGSDVPEGVMVESGLEYNAVNEISAYNGSAIAQYGAEKQWLQHDDTLVHASNSAQYALGVNISAVAQLLGVDETVLFEGSSSASCPLSEPYSAFNKLKIKFIDDSEDATNYYNGPYTYLADTEDIMNNPQHLFVLVGVKTNGITNNRDKLLIRLGWWSASDADISLVPNTNRQFYQSLTGTVDYSMRVTKVIGIGRKA